MDRYRIFIWGTGSVAETVISECSVLEQFEIIGFIDNDMDKQGKIYKDHMIYSSDILNKVYFDKLIILSNFYETIRDDVINRFPYLIDRIDDRDFFYKNMLYRRYENSNDYEIKVILEHIKTNKLDVFNYKFCDKYLNLNIDVTYDEVCKMFFVYHLGKKMYFARRYNTEEKAKEYYRGLLVEQDIESPHRYLSVQFNVKKNDIVIDAGAAEGIFSLQIIEQVSKIYLIETDEEWIEALNETFKEYQKKKIIINKYLTSLNAGKYATLDSLIQEPVNFIKMDIEGNEWDALLGAKKIFEQSDDLKCAICSYHQEFDEMLIKNILSKYGLECSTTEGYMWYPFYSPKQTCLPTTRLCRAIVRGIK